MKRIAGVALALTLIGFLTAPAGAAAESPSAHLNSSAVALGDRVLVQGSGWPGGTLVLLQLCGNGAIDTSADCDLVDGINAGVGQDGTFSMLLHIDRPPSPCPCVVWVTDSASTADVRVPIQVVGVATAPVHERTPVLDLSQSVKVAAKLTGGSWTTLFGAGSTRTLELTVKNTGTMAIPEPRANITFGKGKTPSGFVAPPAIGTIPPGATQTYKVPVSVDTFSFGKYALKGELAGFGKPVPFATGTSVYPWGLLLVAIVVVQLALLYVRDRARGRLTEGEPKATQQPAPVPVAAAASVATATTGGFAPRFEQPIRWAQAEWIAAAATARRLLHHAARQNRSEPDETTPVKTQMPPPQPAWVAAAAAWGRGVRKNGQDPTPKPQSAPPRERAVAPNSVIELTKTAATEPDGLDTLALLPDVDTLTYYATELYSGVLSTKKGSNGNAKLESVRTRKPTDGTKTRVSPNRVRKAAANGTAKPRADHKSTSANGKSNGVAKTSNSRPRASAKS